LRPAAPDVRYIVDPAQLDSFIVVPPSVLHNTEHAGDLDLYFNTQQVTDLLQEALYYLGKKGVHVQVVRATVLVLLQKADDLLDSLASPLPALQNDVQYQKAAENMVAITWARESINEAMVRSERYRDSSQEKAIAAIEAAVETACTGVAEVQLTVARELKKVILADKAKKVGLDVSNKLAQVAVDHLQDALTFLEQPDTGPERRARDITQPAEQAHEDLQRLLLVTKKRAEDGLPGATPQIVQKLEQIRDRSTMIYECVRGFGIETSQAEYNAIRLEVINTASDVRALQAEWTRQLHELIRHENASSADLGKAG
jgi:hypothetical protein